MKKLMTAVLAVCPKVRGSASACERYMQWMMAYPDRHAADITREQLDEAVCDVNRLATQWFSRRPQLQRD